jgi:hypothetical protein
MGGWVWALFAVPVLLALFVEITRSLRRGAVLSMTAAMLAAVAVAPRREMTALLSRAAYDIRHRDGSFG